MLISDALHRYAFTLLKDNDDAKDAVQAVFLKLWEKRTGIDDRQSVKNLFISAVYHYCLNIKRHLKVREQYTAKAPDALSTPDDTLIKKELSKQVWNSLESLPPRCKLIFIKSRFEQMKYAEYKRARYSL